MSNQLPVGVAMGAIAALLVGLPAGEQFSSAGQQAKSENAQRTTYHVQNRSATELAGILGSHFKTVGNFQVVADGPTNTLLITANVPLLAELMNALTKLDRRPQEVLVEVYLIDLAPKKGTDGKTEQKEIEQKSFSGPAEQVASNIKALEKSGAFTAVRRFQLKGVVGQESKLTESASKPYVTGMVVTTGVNGIPMPRRTIAYKNVGTTLSATSFVNADGVIGLDLRVQDERGVQPEDAPVIGTDEFGQPVRSTQFVRASLDTKMTILNGQAVLAKDVQMQSTVGGERT